MAKGDAMQIATACGAVRPATTKNRKPLEEPVEAGIQLTDVKQERGLAAHQNTSQP